MNQNDNVTLVLAIIAFSAMFVGLLASAWLKIREYRARRKPGRAMRRGKQASKPYKPAHDLAAAYQRGKLSDREIALALLDELEAAEAELAALRGAEPVAIEDDGAWLDRLVRALHLLFIGHTGGGKTTLVHWLATRRAELGARVIVCDPDAAPGLWPGCEVYGYGNDFTAINKALGMVAQEVERRRKLRGSGQQRQFPPLHLVIDEYQDTATDCPLAKELVEDVLRRGRKLGVHLVIGVQDKLVKTMGFEGKGDLRKNFSYVVELRKDKSDQRWATLTATGDDEGVTYRVPDLPDPEKLIEQSSMLSNFLTPNQPKDAQPVTGYESGMVRYEGAKIEQKITDNQHTGMAGMVGIEQQDAIPIGYEHTVTGSNHTGESLTSYEGGYNRSGSIEEQVKALHFQEGWSPTKIATESGLVKGDKGKRLATVKAILGLDS